MCVCGCGGVVPLLTSWDTFVQVLYPPEAFPERPLYKAPTRQFYWIRNTFHVH